MCQKASPTDRSKRKSRQKIIAQPTSFHKRSFREGILPLWPYKHCKHLVEVEHLSCSKSNPGMMMWESYIEYIFETIENIRLFWGIHFAYKKLYIYHIYMYIYTYRWCIWRNWRVYRMSMFNSLPDVQVMPLTASGKVDRKALLEGVGPEPRRGGMWGRERFAPSAPTCLNGFFKGKSPYLFRPFLHLVGLAFLLAFFVGGRAITKNLKEIVAAALVRP